MAELIVRYLHFISIFVLCSTLALQYYLIKPELTVEEIKKLSIIDAIYGLSALSVLVAGLSLWLVVGKPSEYYSNNWVFHLKLGIYLVGGICSIRPTIFYRKNKNSNEQRVTVPGSVILLVRVSLVTLVILPLLAVMMARGIGFNY